MPSQHEINVDASKTPSFSGFIKVWKVHKQTNKAELVVDKHNLVMYQGSDLLAKSLVGYPNAHISHMYIGYMNSATAPTPSKVIDRAYSVPLSGYTTPYGALRLPLTFPAAYTAETNYTGNIPVFTVMITTATAEWGAAFTSGGGTPSWVFETVLVAALDPSSASSDLIFSRAQFTPIQYDSNYNLTVTWGVKFESN